MDNQKLSARFEALKGPDREIFLAAYAACYPNGGTPWASDDCHETRFELLVDKEAWLSAAEMLVPEGCVFNAMTDFGLAGRARVWGSALPSQTIDRGWQADGATPALALCAAALKARGL